jgi:uncharacterized protein (TIGR03083 family)
MLTRDDYLDSFHRDAALLEAALHAGGDLDQPVDGCPEWDVAELVHHIGGLHRFVTEALETGDKPAGGWGRGPDDRAALADWFAQGAAGLEAALRARPDEEATYTFFNNAPKTVGTWLRRQCHELAVHRYDAELAVTGTAEAIDPSIAKDGINEYFSLFVPRVDARSPIRIGDASIHLHATDEPGEWFVVCGDHAPIISNEHNKGDVALSGDAGDLLLAIWGRVDPDEIGLAVFGDRDVWTRFQAAASL